MKNPIRNIAMTFLTLALALPLLAAPDGTTAKPTIDINSATAMELAQLPRIGPAVADRIIRYREQNGGFRRVDELIQVRGIGPKTFEGLREQVRVGAPDKQDEPAAPKRPGDLADAGATETVAPQGEGK